MGNDKRIWRAVSLGAIAGVAGLMALGAAIAPGLASEGETEMKHVDWSFSGPFGMYDRPQLQRGYQSTRRSAPTATPWISSRSAIWASRAVLSSRKPR
ncbi:hypothetical protein [Methyloligella halotolerans]